VEAPTVTRTLTRLEKSGWVIRKLGTDKREKVVVLTEKAKNTLPDVEQTVRTFEQDMTKRLSQEQQLCLRELLGMLGTNETE
jgi:DNA-binding MarR family transcriptional regulator